MRALRVVDYCEHYETTESKRTRELSWVATPNGHCSKGFRRLTKRPDFLSVFGAWNIILQQSSKCPTRGLLVNRKGDPYLAVDFADLTGGTLVEFEKAIEVLIGVKWLEYVELNGKEWSLPCKSQGTPADSRAPAGTPALQDSTVHNITQHHITTSAGTPAGGVVEINPDDDNDAPATVTPPAPPVDPVPPPIGFLDWINSGHPRVQFAGDSLALWRGLWDQYHRADNRIEIFNELYAELVETLDNPRFKIWPTAAQEWLMKNYPHPKEIA